MLDDRTVRKINEQIQDELRIVDFSADSHQEKMEALERIAQLKALLDPQPSRQDILRELATALKEQQPSTSNSPADLVSEIFTTFRRR